MMTTRSELNWEGYGREISWTARIIIPSLVLTDRGETTTNPIQVYRCFARDTNQVLPEFKSSMLLLQMPTPVLCS